MVTSVQEQLDHVAAAADEPGPKKMTLVVMSGDMDKAGYGVISGAVLSVWNGNLQVRCPN